MTDEVKEKHPGGRPTLYRPDFCERAIEIMKHGASIAELGLELDCGKTAIYEWIERYPEFAAAIKKGRDFAVAWWEREGRLSLRDKDFNSTLWYMNMKNRHGWRDQQETRHVVDLEDTVKKVRDAADRYKY